MQFTCFDVPVKFSIEEKSYACIAYQINYQRIELNKITECKFS